MIEVICAAIAAVATIICAKVAADSSKADKRREANEKREEERTQQRRKESRLQLAMIAANSELTVGVAMALKNGHCNGEVEAGLKAVQDANKEYTQFLETVALDHMNKGGSSK